MRRVCRGRRTKNRRGGKKRPARRDATPYLADTELTDSAELRDLLQRRMFAVPHLSARIDGEQFDYFDPADPDDRTLLIQSEHPEWPALLRDPSFEGEVDGVNPRLHLAMHEIITNQLWDNDPPEVWLAAKRLLAAGVERHEAFHQIGGIFMRLLHPVLTAGKPMDLDAYLSALRDLGRR